MADVIFAHARIPGKGSLYDEVTALIQQSCEPWHEGVCNTLTVETYYRGNRHMRVHGIIGADTDGVRVVGTDEDGRAMSFTFFPQNNDRKVQVTIGKNFVIV